MEFCIYCMKDVNVTIEEKEDKKILKGTEVKYKKKVAYCPICHEEVFVDDLEKENLNSFYDAYREKLGLISLKDVLYIKDKYEISKRNLSLLLGWGDHTFENYCEGYIPSRQYSDELIKLKDESYFLEKLERYKDSIPKGAYLKAVKSLNKLVYKYEQPRHNINVLDNIFEESCMFSIAA